MDRDKIIQVLTNLLSNAIKFSTEKEITVNYAHINDKLRVEITNQGAPIPENAREKMFRRFSQLQSSTSKEHGSGLGLNISKEIIEKHHGTIDFESNANGLTTFFFYLPL